MKRAYLVWMVSLCSACAMAPAGPPTSGGSPSPAIAEVSGTPVSSEVVGAATFDVPTPQDLRDIEAYGFTGNTYYYARPDVHPASAISPRLESGNHDFEASFRTPWGDQWGVASVKTARLPAPDPGQEAEFVLTRVRPLVAAWAADGKLDTAYEHSPDLAKLRAGEPDPFDPSTVQDEAAILKNVGWPLPYRSEAKKETLLVYAKGVVLRVAAAPKSGDEHSAKVSSQTALQALLTALHDPNARSEEERTGRDYYIGTPFGGVFKPQPAGPFADVGPAYTFSDDVGWSTSFDATFPAKPTWWINANGWPGYGRGLVDAETGKVIRFTRTAENHGDSFTVPTPFVPS